jgi:hypothetical protein
MGRKVSRELRKLGIVPDPSKCVARKRDGTPCTANPMRGSAVCRMHGGSAPQVKKKAQERLAHLSDLAVLKEEQLMYDPDVPPAVQLAAAKDVLDRNNLTGKTTIEVEMKPWEKLLNGADGVDGIVADLSENVPMRAFHSPDSVAVVVVNSERVDDYAIDDADYGDSEAAGADVPADWHPPTVEGQHRRASAAPARPVANGSDAPPRPRYAPTTSAPRRGRVGRR